MPSRGDGDEPTGDNHELSDAVPAPKPTPTRLPWPRRKRKRPTTLSSCDDLRAHPTFSVPLGRPAESGGQINTARTGHRFRWNEIVRARKCAPSWFGVRRPSVRGRA